MPRTGKKIKKIKKTNNMKKWIIILALLASSVLADDTNTQTNTSGSNTNITGGYESTSETT